MKKMCESCSDLEKNTANFLLTYRNTPHSTTGQPPAVLAFNRTLRFNLHQIKPADRQKKEELQSEKEQRVIDSQKNGRSFEAGQSVYVQLDANKTWQPAQVIKRYDNRSNVYDIQCNGRIVKKHADKMKAAPVPQSTEEHVPVISRPMDPLPLVTTVSLSQKDSFSSAKESETGLSPSKVIPDSMVEKGPEIISNTRPARQAKLDAIVKMKGLK